ncbi:MAG: hypothetical protein Q8L59_10560 [Phenylobacterium sp.]|uniref:hypothetical protein n=1 Tax=Phenylobacterium sp. TaxID=1871053 RepID=UPI0027327D4B|nr:hypothetical protein [Phenylobacterium sp.]MDP1642614.1 hypothetical protein [Phenylobacterium sp.]MDP3118745.1 hypothetical protein [Phenylobacterium sp.]
MFEQLFYDPKARADAREGLAEMGRGIVSLLKWAAIIGLGLIILAIFVIGAMISTDLAKGHETTIRWAVASGMGAYGLWLLAKIHDQLAKLVTILKAPSPKP